MSIGLPPTTGPTPRQRFRRLLAIVATIAAAAALGALLWLHVSGVALGPVLVAAVVAGVMLSLLLGGALMGLVYFSARSGADDTADGSQRALDAD